MLKKYASAKILFEEAKQMGLDPIWLTPDGLFSLKYKNKQKLVYYTKLHINSQLGAWISKDKFLTHIILKNYQFPDIPFCFTTQKKDINRFFDMYHPIIQKPVLGQKGENVFLITEKQDIPMDPLDNYIFEEYKKGVEYRCLILKNKVIAMQEKVLNPSKSHPWRKNLEI